MANDATQTVYLGSRSTSLFSASHEGDTMTICFMGRKGGRGASYRISNVPRELYDEFLIAQRPGAFFQSRIKGNVQHPAEKI